MNKIINTLLLSNKTTMNLRYLYHLRSTFFLLLLLLPLSVFPKEDTIKTVLLTNVKSNKVQLRWAVNSPSAWYHTNKNGFVLERFTIVRDGQLLDAPEKVVLATGLRPAPLDNWQDIAQKDNYAAIIAQALYGDNFEIAGGESNIAQMIALSQEQEQRYAMSLLAAEMSFSAAMFAGWGFEDKNTVKGERYLYRVTPLNAGTKHIEPGTAYVTAGETEELPRPIDFTAMWGDASVLLTWDYRVLEPYYNAYHLERSVDGVNYQRLSSTPLTNMQDADRMFFNDSISNNKTYHYRLQGVTTFNDEGPYSDTITGQGMSRLIYVPFITQAIPDEKGGVDITWEFDERGNKDITSFELRHATTTNGTYTTAVTGIDPVLREISFNNPLPESYLVIAAISQTGEPTVSFPHFLQMPDTVPPAVPQGLNGYVDTLGVVHLTWNMNTEPDLLGYRIFRAQTKNEELVPLTDVAIRENSFQDTIHIYNLNTRVYYAVASLDKRYNQSLPCSIVELEKPDVVKPSPPYISSFKAEEDAIHLEWIPGRDETVRSFRIYRRENDEKELKLIDEIHDVGQTTYIDATVKDETTYIYAVTAATKSGLESDVSPEIAIKSKHKESDSDIKRLKATRTSQGVQLKWQHSQAGIRSLSVYRKEADGQLILLEEVNPAKIEYIDTTAKRNTAYEYLLVIKDRYGKVISKNVKVE